MKDTSASPTKRKRKKKAPFSPKRRPGTRTKAATAPTLKRTPSSMESSVEEALRSWRLQEARRRGVPAFRIFSGQTLRAIAQTCPAKAAELIAPSKNMGDRSTEFVGPRRKVTPEKRNRTRYLLPTKSNGRDRHPGMRTSKIRAASKDDVAHYRRISVTRSDSRRTRRAV
jgi:hypothetical protein